MVTNTQKKGPQKSGQKGSSKAKPVKAKPPAPAKAKSPQQPLSLTVAQLCAKVKPQPHERGYRVGDSWSSRSVPRKLTAYRKKFMSVGKNLTVNEGERKPVAENQQPKSISDLIKKHGKDASLERIQKLQNVGDLVWRAATPAEIAEYHAARYALAAFVLNTLRTQAEAAKSRADRRLNVASREAAAAGVSRSKKSLVAFNLANTTILAD